MIDLEEVIDQIEACRSENPECSECMSHVWLLLQELKQWRENPYLMIKKHCESMNKCDDCDYNDYCRAHTIVTTPEEWKF